MTLTLIKHCTKFTIHSHLNSLITKKRKKWGSWTYDIGNPGPGLELAQKCGGLNL